MTCDSMRAVLNKQLGRQAIKNIVFLLWRESLTKWVMVLDNEDEKRCISALDPISSNSIKLTFQIKAGILNRNISKGYERKMGKSQNIIHWNKLTEQQIEALLNEAIAQKDAELAEHFQENARHRASINPDPDPQEQVNNN
ncbi:MAG: hypothetical protein EZS28_028132 [Streblomastix strix]|uniref:Uncharacterized protein n=1 Tax=Streblomastix strix TaxID=222440 RepID=A0A5J4V1U4_9EUKA|nr:MAG: hypothetical protein EZS28_028132 [Streblomastix strix]